LEESLFIGEPSELVIVLLFSFISIYDWVVYVSFDLSFVSFSACRVLCSGECACALGPGRRLLGAWRAAVGGLGTFAHPLRWYGDGEWRRMEVRMLCFCD
jgi:hypothetical protein